MRDGIIGIIIGLVVGVVVGTSFLAPQLATVSEQSEMNQTAAADRTTAAVDAPTPEAPSAPDPLHWRMASAFSSSLPLIGEQAIRFETELRRLSDGDINIRFHEPDALVPAGEILDAVASGTVEAGYSTPSLWREREPALALFAGFPFGPDADEFLAWIHFGGGGRLMQDLYERHGVHGLICGAAAAEGSGWFRNPIQTVEDLQNLRIGISGLPARVMRRLGAATQSMEIGDAFAALEANQLDAVEFSQPAIDFRLGLHKMVPHYYFPSWHQPVLVFDLLINADRWNKLSSLRRARIEAVCVDVLQFGLAAGNTAQFKALKSLVAQGAKVHRWPRDLMDAFRTSWEAEAEELAANDEPFKKVWTKLSEFRRDYEIWHDLAKY